VSKKSIPDQPKFYRHYKGGEYELIGEGRDSETLEEVVIYRAMYDDDRFGRRPIWVRPKSMFFEKVKVNGRSVPRFEAL